MAQHNELGRKGEDLAVRFLRGLGYKILECNWRHEKDEIDIIAKDQELLVIVEVKTRSTAFFGEPEEAVGKRKQQYLIRATTAYIIENEIQNEVRYDIISIIIEKNREQIRHIKEAFYPTL
ncbi:MAG: YraN family protein [Bacteroidetes bacterium]|nr:YraN family protein [Bacteroidota bacterium]